jgi:DNA-binding XRE family transcriptional regulator
MIIRNIKSVIEKRNKIEKQNKKENNMPIKTIRPMPGPQISYTFTSRNNNYQLLQLVPESVRPPMPVEVTVMGDASASVDLPEGVATFKDVMTRIYAKDQERKKRDMEFHKKTFEGFANQVKAGTLNPIRFERMKAGMDQRELARRIGTSASHLVRIEKVGANPRLSTLRKIADALSIPIEELVHE